MVSLAHIDNPKRSQSDSRQSKWYRYYPGFSESFAKTALSSADLEENGWVEETSPKGMRCAACVGLAPGARQKLAQPVRAGKDCGRNLERRRCDTPGTRL